MPAAASQRGILLWGGSEVRGTLLPYHQLRPHTQKSQNHLPLQRKQDAAKRHPMQERANYATHSNRINGDNSPTHGRSMVCCASEIVSKTGEHYGF